MLKSCELSFDNFLVIASKVFIIIIEIVTDKIL